MLTICFPHYQAPRLSLSTVLKYYESFSEFVRSKLHIIIVDDGSPSDDVEDIVSQYPTLNIRLFRVAVDIAWNMSECNNIAFRFAPNGFVLRTDMDHLVPEQTVKAIIESKSLRRDCYYTFRRMLLDKDTLEVAGDARPHINTHMLHRKTYIKARGYDEVFRGNYGLEDLDFRARLQNMGIKEVALPLAVHLLPDSHVSFKSRDTTVNRKRMERRERVSLRHVENFQTPFYEVRSGGERVTYSPSCFPPVLGLMIVKNDAPVMGPWLAHHAHLFECIHVLDGSDHRDARHIHMECMKYDNVVYEHEDTRPVKAPTDHDLRIPGLHFLRRRYGKNNWIAILHPDEFFVNNFHRAIHDAEEQGADHVMCYVLEVLPAKEEKQRCMTHEYAGVQQVFQTFWSMVPGQYHNHEETRFFKDGPGVNYIEGTNRKAAPHGLKQACTARPMYMHQKMFDVQSKYTAYSGSKRSDHFNGRLVGLKFDPKDAFSENYGPFHKAGTLDDLQLADRLDPGLYKHVPTGRCVLFDEMTEDLKPGDTIAVPVQHMNWSEWWHLRHRSWPSGVRVCLVVIHGSPEDPRRVLEAAKSFIRGTTHSHPSEPYVWFTVIPVV